eukprot:407301-Rhodomonas_salina.4
MGRFQQDPEITEEERNLAETSVQVAWRSAKRVWPFLNPTSDGSESASGTDYGGDCCVVCDNGGDRMVPCDAEGCLVSVHYACLEQEPEEHEPWYCEG